MKNFSYFSLKTLIGIALIIIASVAILSGLMESILVGKVNKEAAALATKAYKLQESSKEMKYIVANIQRIAFNSILLQDQDMLILAPIQSNNFYALLDEMSNLLLEDQIEIQNQLDSIRIEYRNFITKVLSVSAQFVEGLETSQENLMKMNKSNLLFTKTLNELTDKISQLSQQRLKEIHSYNRLFHLINIVSFSSIVIAIIFALVLMKQNLSNPLTKLMIFVRSITDDTLDLSKRSDITIKNEIGELSDGLNTMLTRLEKTTVSRDILFEEITERKLLQEEILKAKNELEDRVHKRTEELSKTNKDLNKEIIKRHTIKKAFQESEQQYRSLFETSTDGIICANQEMKIIQWNDSASKIFGYSREEILGKSVQRIVPDHLKASHEKASNHFLKTDKKKIIGKTVEVEGLKKDGTYVPIELSIFAYKINEEYILTAIIRDISERKRVEREKYEIEMRLRQSQKMEAIGTLAGGIAHDFNNILSAIMGFTQLRLLDAKKDSTMENDLQEILNAGARARDLINQVLVFARQSDEELIPMRVDLIAKEVLKLIRSSIPSSIEIIEDIESKSRVVGNPTQCHQIFMNLCTNAAYAMEQEGGILKISILDADIKNDASTLQWGLSAGEYIKIVIKDTGVGIPKNVMKSIFNPFFTTKPPGEGTGMGLSVAHGIVESYGGKIFVDSVLQKGTEFKIFIPITKRSQKNVYISEKVLPTGTEHILIVDDEISITKVLDRVLRHLGYSVTKRNSSIDALELFKTKPNYFDLVITDMTMPNITGDKLASEMIAVRPNIPVILCTGYNKNITDPKVLEIGIKALVHKPIINAELANTVRAVLDGAKKMA